MTDDEVFIRGIVDRPGDHVPRLVYADWLDARGDPRGTYLRAEAASPGGIDRLRPLADGLDPVWVARVSRPPVGVCCDRVRDTDPATAGTPSPVTPAWLDWVERRFDLRLPADYRAFLLNTNGGTVDPYWVRLPGDGRRPDRVEGVPSLHSLSGPREPDTDDESDLVWHLMYLECYRADDATWSRHEHPDLAQWLRSGASAADRRRWAGVPHRDLMIVGTGLPTGELEWLCLDVRGAAPGRVFLVAPDLWSPEIEDYRVVAESFAEFLSLLSEAPAPEGIL